MNRRDFLRGAASALAGAALLHTIPDAPEVWSGVMHNLDIVVDRPIIVDQDTLVADCRFHMTGDGVLILRDHVRFFGNTVTLDGAVRPVILGGVPARRMLARIAHGGRR